MTYPMHHRTEAQPGGVCYVYGWKGRGGDVEISAGVETDFQTLIAGHFEEFILEHYWGYNQLPGGRTNEYQVEHPPWRAAVAVDVRVSPEIVQDYPDVFTPHLEVPAHSAFVAEGSRVSVFLPRAF